tara:strand:+ start:2044 stop:2691 length:648 start_codon:yes stop_codon:yes gene_type:complete
MMYVLDQKLWFPDPCSSNEHGIVAVGGDLSAERVLLAYTQGIFPWFSEDEPIIWWCPDPRMVLYPTEFKISKSFKKTLRTTSFTVTFNTAFSAVIEACSKMERPGQEGTWITQEMKETYVELHRQNIAISIEVWDKDILVGGLYGMHLPSFKLFSGESMFSKKTDASKIAFAHLVAWSIEQKHTLIDCQVYTSHLESLGAREIDREVFLSNLRGE